MRKILINTILLSGTIYLSLILSEYILRIIYVIPNSVIVRYSIIGGNNEGNRFNIKQLEFKTDYKFNSMGFRGDEFTVNKNKKTILFLGDSFTEGWGVDLDKSFPNLIANSFKCNIINLSQLATQPVNYFNNMLDIGLSYNPQIVVLGLFVGNDFMNGRYYPTAKNFQIKTSIKNDKSLLDFWYLNTLIKQIHEKNELLRPRKQYDKYWEHFGKKRIDKKYYMEALNLNSAELEKKFKQLNNDKLIDASLNAQINPRFLVNAINNLTKPTDGYIYNTADYNNVINTVKEIHKILKERNIKLYVIVIPDVHQIHTKKHEKILLNFLGYKRIPNTFNDIDKMYAKTVNDLNNSKISFIDIKQKFEQDKTKEYYYLIDGHYNEFGHKMTATSVINRIRGEE